MKHFKTLFCVFTLCLFALTSAATAEEKSEAATEMKKQEAPKPFKVGDEVSSLDLMKEDGQVEKVSLAGPGITAMSFFNSSCSACRIELDLLNSLREEKKDLRIIALCVDAAGAKSLERFVEITKFQFDYYLDPEFKVAERFGFSFTPGLVLFDEKGSIYYVKPGFMARDKEELISQILK